MPTGYCTVEDVRRVFQETEFTRALDSADNEIVVDAIAGVSVTVEKATKRHWYAEGGIDEDTHGLVDTGPKTRDDEHDIQTHGGLVHGESERDRYRYRKNSDALLEADPRTDRRRRELRRDPKREIRIATGEYHDGYNDDVPAYTRITFDRKDVDAINGLHVINADGAYDDWADDGGDYTGGVGLTNRGDDWWVRVNNGGVSELYLDVHAMADDIASLSNAVYVDFDYGTELGREVRRGVAMLAAAEIVDDELVVQMPDNARYLDIETKAERWGRQGVQKLEDYIEEPEILEAYR